MSRPKVIQLEQGTVSLSGFSKEVSEALSAHIKLFGKPQVSAPSDVLVQEDNKHVGSSLESFLKEENITLLDVSTLTSKAIGINKENNEYNLVTVAYNLSTKEATVHSVNKMVGNRDAIAKFKIEADKLKFV